jgi:hypothetical protein
VAAAARSKLARSGGAAAVSAKLANYAEMGRSAASGEREER